jgi:hypothetical protein
MVDFLGVVLGAGVALASTIAVKWWEEGRRRRALRAAFRAEIDALLKIAEVRRHEANAEAWLAKWRSGEDYAPQLFGLNDDQMPEDPVYKANVDKIGMLGADAADVVLFYTNLTAVRINLRVFVTGQIKDFTIEKRIGWVEAALAIWRPTKVLGRSLVERLQPTRWPRRFLPLPRR